MTSPLTSLSLDLKDLIFNFLPLQSCLRYSQTSHQSLHDVVPHLKRRQSVQFCVRHVYHMGNPYKLRPIDHMDSGRSNNNADTQTTNLLQPLRTCESIHVVPSVRERIESLYRALPYSHSCKDRVRKLCLELQEEGPPHLLSQEGIVLNSHFPTSVQELHSVTSAHRAHDELVRACTVECIPPSANAEFGDNPTVALSTTLEQYIGDVLLAYFTMGHVASGIVEGCTSHSHWTDHLLSPDPSPQLWYKRWVFLHSCILRTFPLTSNQLQHYKLPLVGILGRSNPQNIEYIHPHYCFLGGGGRCTVVQETTKVVSYLARACIFGEDDIGEGMGSDVSVYRMDTRWHSFGPLGPAFRGRDHVQSTRMSPGPLVALLSNPRFAMAPTWLMLEERRHVIHENVLYHAWFTSEIEGGIESEPLGSWFLRMPEICYKNRPMTVESPVISLNEQIPDPSRDWDQPEWIRGEIGRLP